MLLKEQIILNLGLESLEKEKKEKIAKEIVKLSLKKALDDLVGEMGPEKLKIWVDESADEAEEKEAMKKVFELFNKNLEKDIYEFRKRLGKEI